MLRHYTTDGFRVLALACKVLGSVATFEEALQLPRSVPVSLSRFPGCSAGNSTLIHTDAIPH